MASDIPSKMQSSVSIAAEIRGLLDDQSFDVSREIAPGDPMYAYDPEIYFRAGSEALSNIRLAMAAGKTQKVEQVLDFACGWGRVLRTLKAAFPDARLTACDIQPRQVDYCVGAFGVEGVYSDMDPTRIKFDKQFDVIWSGSLMTHIDEERWTGFLRVFEAALADRGVLVFTTYGRFTADGLRTGRNLLNLTEEQAEQVVRDYDQRGFGCSPSSADADTVVSRAWVGEQLDRVRDLELLLYRERGWLGQDVIACTKGVVSTWTAAARS
jgi:hypothetical protein